MQLLLVFVELAEDVREGSLSLRDLVLQRVVMFLFQSAAGKRVAHKRLHRAQVGLNGAHAYDQRITVPEPATHTRSELQPITVFSTWISLRSKHI